MVQEPCNWPELGYGHSVYDFAAFPERAAGTTIQTAIGAAARIRQWPEITIRDGWSMRQSQAIGRRLLQLQSGWGRRSDGETVRLGNSISPFNDCSALHEQTLKSLPCRAEQRWLGDR